MSDKFTISFSGKEVNCLGRTYPLGQLFMDFLELDLSEYEEKRLNIKKILDTNNIEVMEKFTKITPKELKRGFKGLSFYQLGITDKTPLKKKYIMYAIYKALLKIEHKYFDILNYPSMSGFSRDKIIEIFDLVSLQKRYQQAMKDCLLKDDTDLTTTQRFAKNREKIDGKAELMFEVSDGIMYEVFMASDISSLLYIEFMKMIQNNVWLAECKSCYKIFLPETKGNYNVKYCKKEECQKIGAVKRFKDKVRDNPIYGGYEKVYKRFYARKRKGLISQSQFDDWLKKASKLKKDALKGILSTDDFIKMISDI